MVLNPSGVLLDFYRPAPTRPGLFCARAQPWTCGHLGRKGNGPPGWQTPWLGRRNLRLLVEGVQLAAQLLDD